MKNKTLLAFCLFFFVAGSFLMLGQATKKKEVMVQKRTLVGQFEPAYVIPVEDRIALKEKRISKQHRTKRILDTLDISDRKRRKLMRELKRSPFSDRITKTILAETKFQDEIEKTPKK